MINFSSNFPSNLPNFLLTQISGPQKPFMLKAADYLLAPLRIPTSYEQTVINYEGGLPRKQEGNGVELPYKVSKVVTISSIALLAGFPLVKTLSSPLYFSGFFILTSLVINEAKELNTHFIKKIDERGDFLGCKLLKAVALVISASLPIIVGSFSILGLYMCSAVSLPIISFIAFGCLALQLSAGALLKVLAYKTNLKVKFAYDNYLINCKNPELVDNTNKIEQSFAKLQNIENIGLFNHLNSDICGLIFPHLSLQNIIQFRTSNKELSKVFSTNIILTQRIKDSFSIDFINKLGLERILKAMESEPIQKLGFKTISSKFESHMENKQIAWGHESVQEVKTNSKLFLIFNNLETITHEILQGDNYVNLSEKYKMISSHDNSEISWEQRSISKINFGFLSPLTTSHIYKVDEDHYSIVPISQLRAQDYNDDTLIFKTDFFKNFKNPEALVHI